MEKNPDREEDVFLALRTTLENDLRATGFSPDREPPGEEPRIPQGLKYLPNEDIKGLYDSYLSFFEYISDQLAKASSYATISKARLETVAAEATLATARDSKLTNSELRKAFITKSCLGAKRDYVYFKAQVDVHEARLRKISKSMDRLGRELWFRTQEDGDRQEVFSRPQPSKPKSFPGKFKRVRRED